MVKLITSVNASINENALYYFRKQVTVKQLTKSIINLFAESRYKLYLNGNLVAAGPCKRTSEMVYYDTVDISPYLVEGDNLFEVAVLQLATKQSNEVPFFMENFIRDGSMALCIWGNAGEIDINTDEGWNVAKENGIKFFSTPIYRFYNVASLAENISVEYKKNLKFEPAKQIHELYSLDDENKRNTDVIRLPAIRRPIPMMYFNKKSFIGNMNNIYDAGKMTCGYVRLKCKGNGKLHITYAECMSFLENNKVIKRKRDDKDGIVVGNYDVLDIDGDCTFEPFWMRTFRYIEIRSEGDVFIESFDYIETGYPIKVSNKYDFGNYVDNKLFEISVNTLKRCMHETYMDCPYYEQLQYTMDTHLQMIFTYQLTTDKALAEKAIDDFAKSYRVGGLTQSRYPTNTAQYIPGFSLFFVLMLYEHAKRFNDTSFIRKYLPVADGIIDWFVKRLDGYMVTRSNLWDFIDWSEGYDFGQIPVSEPISVYSLMLAYTLEKTSEMHTMLGNNISDYLMLADKIKTDVKERCFDKKTGLYADSPSKTHFAQHPQIWAVLCEMEIGEKAKEILIKSMELTCKSTSAYIFFLFRALEKTGIYELSKENMDSLRSLVGLGCTTTPEWVGEDVRSECHAWSAVAIYEFTAKVLGVTYRDKNIHIEPYTIGRDYARGEVATPEGMVYCEWKIDNGEFIINIDLPENSTAILKMPDGNKFEAVTGKYVTNY